MEATFISGSVGLLALTSAALVFARRKTGVDTFWYALAAVGAATSVVAYVAAMGVWLAWAAVGPVPAVLPRAELAIRPDVLLVTTLMLGAFAELAKSYGVTLFHTRLNRGMWPVFGASVGAGAGMLQAFWVLGATGWAVAWGLEAVEARHFWLLLQHGSLIALEAACGALVLYGTARKKRWLGVVQAGGIHGLALLAAALVPRAEALSFGHAWLPSAIFVIAAALAATLVTATIKTRGWPA